ncbi:MAG TPA: hypothetical protein VKA74_17715 [Myxococcota bacterium]|nr:hypothetical protein [Myxococcota bacterium]HKK94011.1 hypothetical protein [Longimicrobiales bacterium]
MTGRNQAQDDRLGKPPAERFAGDSHLLDLRRELARLRSEAHEGRLHVEADGEEHELTPGCVLTLTPTIEHDVRTSERSAMLLTVHMEKGER